MSNKEVLVISQLIKPLVELSADDVTLLADGIVDNIKEMVPKYTPGATTFSHTYQITAKSFNLPDHLVDSVISRGRQQVVDAVVARLNCTGEVTIYEDCTVSIKLSTAKCGMDCRPTGRTADYGN